jgi:hypothetical protein
MDAIGLEIEGKMCVLPPELVLDIIIKADVFNMEEVEGTSVLGLELPFSSPNHLALNYAYRADVLTDVFRDYDAALYWNGRRYKRGVFVLETIEGQRYKGFFRTDSGIVGGFKDVLLPDFLKGVAPFNQFSLVPEKVNDHYFRLGSSDFWNVFTMPFMLYKGQLLNSPWSDKRIYALAISLPVVLEAIATKIGFDIDFVPQSADFTYQRMAITNLTRAGRLIDDYKSERTVSPFQHLPEITLSKFINGLKVFGVFIEFDTVNSIMHIDFLRRVLEEGVVQDWTAKAVPSDDKRPNDFNAFDLSFGPGFKPDLEEVVFFVNEITDLPAPSPINTDNVYLVRKANAYYQLVDINKEKAERGRSVTPLLQYAFVGYADQDFISGKDAARKATTDLSVAQLLDIYQLKVKGNISNNGSGLQRFTFFPDENRVDAFMNSGRNYSPPRGVRISRSNSPVVIPNDFSTKENEDQYNDISRTFNFYPFKHLYEGYVGMKVNYYLPTGEIDNRFYNIVARSADVNNMWIDIDRPYLSNGTDVALLFNIPIDPVTEYADNAQAGIGHTIGVPDVGNVTGKDYFITRATDFTNAGGIISNYDLRFDTGNGLVENLWKPVNQWAAKTYEREQLFRLGFADLYNFSRRNRVRVENTIFLVQEIQAKLRMDGSIPISTVRLRKA